ncbi:MAG: heparin lyase I family protein [Anditalea sp.]
MGIIKDYDFTSLHIGDDDLKTNPATGRAYDNYFEIQQEGADTPVPQAILSDEVSHPSHPNSIKFNLDWKYPRPYSLRGSFPGRWVYRTEVGTRYPGLTLKHWFAFTYVFPQLRSKQNQTILQWLISAPLLQVLSFRISHDNTLVVRLHENNFHPRLNYYYKLTENEPFNVVVKINAEYGTGEYCKVWINNELFVDFKGDLVDGTSGDSDLPVQVKLGIYKAAWNSDARDSKTKERIYFDEDAEGNLTPIDPFPVTPNHIVSYLTHLRFANMEDSDAVTYSALHPDGDKALSGIDY